MQERGGSNRSTDLPRAPRGSSHVSEQQHLQRVFSDVLAGAQGGAALVHRRAARGMVPESGVQTTNIRGRNVLAELLRHCLTSTFWGSLSTFCVGFLCDEFDLFDAFGRDGVFYQLINRQEIKSACSVNNKKSPTPKTKCKAC